MPGSSSLLVLVTLLVCCSSAAHEPSLSLAQKARLTELHQCDWVRVRDVVKRNKTTWDYQGRVGGATNWSAIQLYNSLTQPSKPARRLHVFFVGDSLDRNLVKAGGHHSGRGNWCKAWSYFTREEVRQRLFVNTRLFF